MERKPHRGNSPDNDIYPPHGNHHHSSPPISTLSQISNPLTLFGVGVKTFSSSPLHIFPAIPSYPSQLFAAEESDISKFVLQACLLYEKLHGTSCYFGGDMNSIMAPTKLFEQMEAHSSHLHHLAMPHRTLFCR